MTQIKACIIKPQEFPNHRMVAIHDNNGRTVATVFVGESTHVSIGILEEDNFSIKELEIDMEEVE